MDGETPRIGIVATWHCGLSCSSYCYSFWSTGSWPLLVDGLLPLNELKELLGVEQLPYEEQYQFNTLAGFVIAQIGRLPRVGDQVEALGPRFLL